MTDRDVRPARLAVEFGIDEDEARQMRKDIEFGRIMAPQRWVMSEERVQLERGQNK